MWGTLKIDKYDYLFVDPRFIKISYRYRYFKQRPVDRWKIMYASHAWKVGIPESLPQCGDWLVFLFLSKMCKICLNCILDATFLDCLALTFCDVIGELLPEWACLTLQDWTTFLLTSKLADIPVSRVRKMYFLISLCNKVVKCADWH